MIHLEQTEPGDDIDEDLVTIRIEEPEVSSKDLGMILKPSIEMIIFDCASRTNNGAEIAKII